MFLLDTNILSERIRARPHLPVMRKLLSYEPTLLFASEMTRFELRRGAVRHANPEKLWSRIASEVLPLARWLAIDSGVTMVAADLSARLEREGQPIESADIFIAATALAHNLILVTRNLRHFERVPGLVVENWFAES